MSDLSIALNKLLGIEGAYANNPNDRGGETYCGISRKFYPAWQGWKIIDGLRNEPNFPKTLANVPGLKEWVKDLYRVEFWNKIKGDDINAQEIADEIFDTAVNMGCVAAAGMVQHALNLLNRNCKDYKDVAVDSKIGKETITALNTCTELPVLLRTLNALQAVRYIHLCDSDSTQEIFFHGWLKRAG